jgi:hypothetical protein
MAGLVFAGILLPIICGLAIAWTASWLRRRSGSWRERVGWEGALLLVALAACNLTLVGWHGFPPVDVKFWPIFVALAAVPLAAMTPSYARWYVRWALLLVVISVASVLLLHWLLVSLSTAEKAELLSVVVLGWLMTLMSWSYAATASAPGALLTALLVTTGASAFGALIYGSFTQAQVVGILGLALAVLALMHWLGGMSRIGAASVAVAAGIFLPMWWILGVTMSDLPRWAPPLFMIAGASSALTAMPVMARQSGWKRIACVALVSFVVVAPVLICGVMASMHQAGGGVE